MMAQVNGMNWLKLSCLVILFNLCLINSLTFKQTMVSTKFTLQQFINVPGLKAIALIFTSPHLIIPNLRVKHVDQINYEQLVQKGIKCLVFDKDNTLSYCYSETLHPSVIPTIAAVNKLFPQGVAILSNSVGSSDDEDYKMAAKTEQTTGIPVICHQVKKPGCLNEVLEHFEKTLKKKVQPEEICVIGMYFLWFCGTVSL